MIKVILTLYNARREVMESHTYHYETQQEVDREVMLLKLKYPFTEFEVIERQE